MLKQILDWSEAWAVLIPLVVLLKYRRQPDFLKPVIIYVSLALILNLAADIIWKQHKLGLNLSTKNNNPIYNTHSIIRLLLFSLFFVKLEQPFLTKIKKIVPVSFIVFVFVNFIYFDSFFTTKISHRLHSVEAGVLLFYCLQYYFFLLQDENETSIKNLPSFWIVTGLSIFEVASFSIYLFYDIILKSDLEFAKKIWIAQKIPFIVFCILTAKAFTLQRK